ncbi:DUF4168 domain-containing protein [Idiomarina xiamenensis]|uniref:DUF4168 domain-containing protein n=1 Tax=Idiomarina xiamenensis 10-D-4 TaxID=740709 RepID=K2JZA1_9GAMM|nr:DUF4168 domain-containing protein [Idiomarina xiamenensis]EKE79937.1 hypothetical protein A10D4_12173 [Idiomarina xiamenensis 10-D-4]
MRKTLLAIATVAAMGTASTAALAQDAQQQQQAMPQAEQQAEPISDAMLLKFSEAMKDVRDITGKYADEFQNAENAEEAQEIQQKAQEEMIAAVNDAGLTPQEYNMIVQQAQQDEALRARLQELTGEDA